ncbi:Alpha/beta hydrolase fold-1 [Arabidopsis thaliana x Arabidopsis arenosa]|uniref:Alpha/beta hydrolase fold-1 n=2 Tax=Arabidopsis TaxID=3701 RepID=A0A8T2AY88_9BRAS|nr:Alpha/beta hydrolase fold-1 [Arabidopsis thaliana x Arabidopsis arenosa]
MKLVLASSSSLAPCFCVRFFPPNHNILNPSFSEQRKIKLRAISVSCGMSEVLKSDLMEPEAETLVNKRNLYAPIEPYSTGNLKVSDVHTLYWEQSGKPDGHPVVFLHGGPGGGTAPGNRRVFDPEFYRIILFDQRGAGKSTPHACLEENTTWDLVNDIEKLREYLKIPEWLVFGGSWGSTLALAYSQSHPDKVTGLVLRGIFLLRKKEIDWFYEGGAAAIYPDAWEEFRDLIPENERGSLVDAYHKRLNSDDLETQYAAARAWTKWEMMTAYLRPNLENVQKAEDDKFSLAFARIENHYFVNKGFFPSDSYLLDNVDKIRHIKTTIVQGRYDVCCPMMSAWDLHKAWPEAELKIVYDAGHSANEPGIAAELVVANEKMKALMG